MARIVERFAPSRVWQWGSLLDRYSFSEISDIDIAIEGLDGGPAAWFASSPLVSMASAIRMSEWLLTLSAPRSNAIALRAHSIPATSPGFSTKESARYRRTISFLALLPRWTCSPLPRHI